MSKEVFNAIKDDLKWVGTLFLLALIIFKIVYFKENIIVLLRYAISLFWLFVLPGYFAVFYWHDKLDFIERLVIGIALSAAIIGGISYYLGLAGLNIKYHGIILPLIIIGVSGIIMIKKKQD